MKNTNQALKTIWGALLILGMLFGSGQVFAQSGTWTTASSIPTERYHIRGGVVNNILYVVGGWNGFAPLNTLEAYDPATNTWNPKTSMPTPRLDPAVGVVNGTLYVVGGSFDCCATLNSVEAYDPTTDSWATKNPMPTARRDPGVGVVNGILYAVGGWSGAALNTVEAYDPATDAWVTKAPMPTARAGATVEVVNGVLYAMGGWTDIFGAIPGLATVEAYDPATDTWTTKTSMPTPRFHHGAGVISNIVYVVGGWDGSAPLNSTEAYDPATDTWAQATAMPTARRSFATGVVNNVLYAVGGYSNGFAVTVNEAFNPNAILEVTIDIKPGSPVNAINPRSKGVTPVAILTTSTFDAASVAPATVRFGRTGTEAPAEHFALQDVNADGKLDLILLFRTQATGIQCGDTSASLTGQTTTGQAFQGSDSIVTVGCSK